MVFTRQTVQVRADLCRPCIGRYFLSYTLTTLFLGWWGMISFVMTPFILLNNVGLYLLALRLPEPGMNQREDGARQQLLAYFSDKYGHGCDK